MPAQKIKHGRKVSSGAQASRRIACDSRCTTTGEGNRLFYSLAAYITANYCIFENRLTMVCQLVNRADLRLFGSVEVKNLCIRIEFVFSVHALVG